MSDPIAAAEAAGKARDIANRFETAVFLIAYGIAEKDGLYEADPHRYPYSQAFRHGMNILAALCAECSDNAEELLPTFNESDFIRNSAASDVREWTDGPVARRVQGSRRRVPVHRDRAPGVSRRRLLRRDVGMLRGTALCGKRPLGRPSGTQGV